MFRRDLRVWGSSKLTVLVTGRRLQPLKRCFSLLKGCVTEEKEDEARTKVHGWMSYRVIGAWQQNAGDISVPGGILPGEHWRIPTALTGLRGLVDR